MDFSAEQVKQLRLLVALARLNSRQALKDLREEIEGDSLSSRIFDLCKVDVEYPILLREFVESKVTSERTLQRRLSEMTDKGVLTQTKKGVYVRTDLLE